jgi:hypothetical protein
MVELVVARYREDLSWLGNIPPTVKAVVYDKRAGDRAAANRLPNVGREAHTYLHHICERYDALADLTVFCQGKPFDHAFDFHVTLRELANNPEVAPPFRWLGHIVDTDSHDGQLFRTWSKNPEGVGLDLRAFHHALFGDDGPAEYAFYLGAQFVVRRELILERPRSFYEHARRISEELVNAAHCFERCWDRVFGMPGSAAAVLGNRKTAFLKPIKKQLLARGADERQS